MELKKGYKQTEVGVIPEDWTINRFGDITQYTKGFAFKSIDYKKDGTRIIRVSDTTFDSIKKGNEIYVVEKSNDEYRNWKLCEHDLIFTTVGSKPPMYDSMVGKVIMVSKAYDGCLLNQNAVIIRSKQKTKEIQTLLLSNFRSKRYLQFIELIYRGNANQASITLKELFDYKIPLPPTLAEQTAIATVLSDTDELISSLERLIAKKQAIKQGAMQELLKPKEGWVKKKLGEVAEIVTGSTPPTNVSSNYGNEYLFIGPGDLGNKWVRKSEKSLSEIGFQMSRKIPYKSILFTCIGSTIGKCSMASKELTTNQQINSILPNTAYNSDYLYYQLGLMAPMIKFSAGEQAVPLINKTEFSLIRIPLPPTVAEQTAIAETLSNMDAEIQALSTKLQKLKSVKQGMMQELLTGKTRLV